MKLIYLNSFLLGVLLIISQASMAEQSCPSGYYHYKKVPPSVCSNGFILDNKYNYCIANCEKNKDGKATGAVTLWNNDAFCHLKSKNDPCPDNTTRDWLDKRNCKRNTQSPTCPEGTKATGWAIKQISECTQTAECQDPFVLSWGDDKCCKK